MLPWIFTRTCLDWTAVGVSWINSSASLELSWSPVNCWSYMRYHKRVWPRSCGARAASCQEFPGGPVGRTQCFHCRWPGSNPWSSQKPSSVAKEKRTRKNCSLSFCSFTLGKLMRDLDYKTSEYLERIVAEVCKLPFSCETLITYGSARLF